MGMTSDAVRRFQRALAEEEERLVGESASRERARRAEADRLIRSRLAPIPPEVTAADSSKQVDEFVLVGELGRGGGGEVWKAWDRNFSRWVAVKRPAPGIDRRWFLQEALAAARLSHPTIVPVHRVVERATRKESAARTPSAEQFARELEAPRGRPWLLIAAAGVVLAGFLVHGQLKPSPGREFMRRVDQALEGPVREWARFDQLEKVASDQLEKDPAAELYRVGRGRIRAARLLEGRGSEWAEADADLSLIPDRLTWREGRAARAQLLGAWADFELRGGRDPGDRFDRAEADAEAGLRGRSPHPESWAVRGRIRQMKMEHLLRSRADPGSLADGARRDFDEALRLGVRDRGEVLLLRAALGYTLADLEAEKGGDPLPRYASAEDDYSEAAALDRSARVLLMRGCVRYNSAVHLKRADRADEAKRKAAEALADFEKVTAEDPTLAGAAGEYAGAARRLAGE